MGDFELKLRKPKFDRSRIRVHYGNLGEIIAQEVLKKQGFEVWLTRPVGNLGIIGKDYIPLHGLTRFDEDTLRRHYNLHIRKQTWEEYRDEHLEFYKRELRDMKKTEAFLGDKLDAFKQYLKRIKLDVVGERMYIPDLVAKKNGEIYVIEVKSSERARKSFLKGKKLKGLMLAREFGLIPTVVTLNLKIETSEFELEEL